MHPYMKLTLWSHQVISISSYRLFFLLACLPVILISIIGIRQKRLPLHKSLIILLVMVVSVPLGARILHILTNPVIYQQGPAKMWSLQFTGFSLMGGLILAAVTGVIMSLLMRFDPWPLADSIAPGLGVGIVLMRTGCFLNGCCFGKVTNLPWAVHFPVGSIPYKYYLPGVLEQKTVLPFALFRSPGVHPTQIYELLAALVITILIVLLARRKPPSGVLFLLFALLFAIFRWVNSLLRVPAHTLMVTDWFYPLLYSAIILLSIILLIFRFHQPCPQSITERAHIT